jgi:hypothetical protein
MVTGDTGAFTALFAFVESSDSFAAPACCAAVVTASLSLATVVARLASAFSIAVVRAAVAVAIWLRSATSFASLLWAAVSIWSRSATIFAS